MIPSYVFADDTSNQLDAKLIPSQIMANTDDMIQVYPQTYGNTIENLIATSSDSSIVQILSIEKDDAHHAFNIKIRAANAGQATINLAASGFASQELPITIYPNSNGAASLLIKATPKIFAVPGSNYGYISVETVNSNGIPTPVSADMQLKLSVSDNSIASLTDNQMVIKQGSYFAIEKFVVNKPGVVQIFASSSSMQPVSTTVTINDVAAPYTLQAYAYPPIVNDLKNAMSYVIVQLHDSSGNPVIATNDIPVSVRVVNATDLGAEFSSTATINTSDQRSPAQVNDILVIKKGSYWGYVPVDITAGINATFNVNIAAKDYVISTIPTSTTITSTTTATSSTTAPGSTTTSTGTTTTSSKTAPSGTSTTTTTTSSGSNTIGGGKGPGTTATGSTTGTGGSACTTPIALSATQVQIVARPQSYVLDDKTPCFYPLPILTTGNNELIGVLALAGSSGYPVIAKSDLQFQIDSSDTSTVSVPGVEMSYGSQSGLVFAKVGNTPNPVTLNVVSAIPQQVTPSIISTSKTTSGLVADSLLTTIMPNVQFPLAVYTTNNGALDSFQKDFTALISPQESISPGLLTITKGDPIFLTDETLLKEGTQNMTITTSDYASGFLITGASLKPSSIVLGFPDQIFSNNANLFSIELLDDKQLPMIAEHDINVKLVSSNPSVLDVPESVQIHKGSYYATFDANAKTAGTAEIAVLTDEIPLSKFDITVTSYTTVVNIDSNDHADNKTPLTATVTATYNQLPLAGLNVSWTVTGAITKNMDTITDKDGKATISLITNDPNTVNIQASVGGGPYQTVTATKQVSINQPLLPPNPTDQSTQSNQQSSGFTVMGVSPLLFIIPGAAAASFVVLKKKQMLEGITERINIADRFSEIKERMSESRQK